MWKKLVVVVVAALTLGVMGTAVAGELDPPVAVDPPSPPAPTQAAVEACSVETSHPYMVAYLRVGLCFTGASVEFAASETSVMALNFGAYAAAHQSVFVLGFYVPANAAAYASGDEDCVHVHASNTSRVECVKTR